MEEMYQQYEQALNTEIRWGMGVLIFIGILGISVAIFCMVMKQPRLVPATVGVFVLLLAVVWYFGFYPFQKDISEKAYVIYEGQFYIEEYYQPYRSGTYMRIIDDHNETAIRYRVLCDVGDVTEDTAYMGYFIYSANSKSLVDFHVDKIVDFS